MSGMDDNFVAIHVHWTDADPLIEEYRLKGYVVKERTEPTILAQAGFERIVFVPSEFAESEPTPLSKTKLGKLRRLLFE
jgi:hypothetical protein